MLDFPEEFTLCFMGSWMDLRDVAQLDSALCNAKNRAQWLKLLTDKDLVLQNVHAGNSAESDLKRLLQWIVSKKLRVSKIALPAKIESMKSLRDEFFRAQGHSLTSVNIHQGEGLLQNTSIAIARSCLNLTHLQLDGCWDMQDDTVTPMLSACKNLTYISLAAAVDISDGTYHSISKLTTLRHIDLSSTQMSDKALLLILKSNGPQLTVLNVSNCIFLTPASIAKIATHCVLLETLDISRTSVDDNCVARIVRACTRLTHINVHTIAAALSDATCALIGSNCKCLTFFESSDLTATGLISIAVGCSSTLSSLRLSGCDVVDNTAMIAVAEHCCNLTDLDVTDCDYIADTGLAAIATSCTKLQRLLVSRTNAVSEGTIVKFAESSGAALRVMSLYHCVALTDAAVIAIAAHCPDLEALFLNRDAEKNVKSKSKTKSKSSSVSISDAAIVHLAQRCPALRILDLSNHNLLTNTGTTALAQGCPKLRQLVVVGCPLITDSAVEEVLLCCKQLRRESVVRQAAEGVR